MSFNVTDALKNGGVLCHDTSKINSDGIWHHNPLLASAPLLLLQLSLISLTSKAVDYLIQPLGQSSVVSQILGGIILGPSLMGQMKGVAKTIFPERGTMTLETTATFGLTLFFFSIGVKMDTGLMFRPERAALIISLSLFIFTTLVPLGITFYLVGNLPLEPTLKKALPVMVQSQSLIAFPPVAIIMAELKIVNTEVGRLAMGIIMFYDILAISACALGFSFLRASAKGLLTAVGATLSTLSFVLIIIFVVRPLMLRFILTDKTITTTATTTSSSGNHVNDLQLSCMFVILFLCTLASELVGQDYFLGPMVLGLSVPDSSPAGNAVVSKLDSFVSGVLYPTFLTISGLKTNIFTISLKETKIAAFVVVSGFLIKFAAIMVPANYINVPLHDAFVLSLLLNARGISELLLYNLLSEDKVITDQEFTLMVISVVLVTAVVVPLVKYFYKPSKRYIPLRRMTIQHHKKETEFRIAVCIYQQDNIPTIVNLMEASYASEQQPISVIALILVEVVGSTAPMLLAYRPQKSLDQSNSRNNHITNAFQQYESQNNGNAVVQTFTNMSHFSSMHDDICRVAIDQKVNILIVPFHKQWAVDGTVGAVSRSIQAMNGKVIDRAPCSVGILIDRGPIGGALSILNSKAEYHVAIIFIGGADDVESLAYGARMARHERVKVTVNRFLLFGHDNSRERKHDADIIKEYRLANAGNEKFVYREELVKDGVGLAESLRKMQSDYDLILVGRNHQQSPLLFGLHEWSECPELGVIGDLLASADTGGTASVLVIQQQRMASKMNTAACKLQNERDMYIHDESTFERVRSGRNSSVSISIDSN